MTIKRRISPALRPAICLVAGLLPFLIALSCPVQPGPSTNQFLFLRLRLEGDAVILVKASVAKGHLKPQAVSGVAEPLVISLESTDTQIHWSQTIENPTRQRVEYEDSRQPGALRTKIERLGGVEFVVRAPMISGAKQLSIYRAETGLEKEQGQTKGRLLGRIKLPEEVTR